MENAGPRVLIIDDEKGLRTGTQRLLENEGYSVETAENGTDGIALGIKEDFDIAIIDLKMPDIDGIEVLKEIRKSRPNTICFIATAYASYETAIEATKIGAHGYIPKPFTPEELIYHVKQGYEKRLLILESERLKKEREERLLEVAFEKSRLNTIVNAIIDGVIVVNKSGELVLFNPGAMKFFDLNRIIIGEYILGILPASVAEQINKIIKAENFQNISYSAQIELKPNRELVVEFICSPVPHPDGSIAGAVIAVRDITEMKKVEYIKSQFVSMVAHELKAPVAAVLGFLNLILDPGMNISGDQQKDYLRRSQTRLKALVDMVNDLLDISRMEIKKKEREIKDLNVVDIIKSTIEFLELELKKKGITVEMNFGENIPSLKADSNEINRLYTNIISNSMKYNKDNGKIMIDVRHTGNFIVTKIADTGIGMKPEEKARLFQEFFRAKNESTRNIGGTGLGLSIVKRIVESYAGIITVESTYGSGSAFIISFPVTH